MAKKITARFPGTCKKCGESIRKGERVFWGGKGAGSWHIGCADSDPKTPDNPNPENAPNIRPSDTKPNGFRHLTIQWDSLRDRYRRLVNTGQSDFNREKNRKLAGSYPQKWLESSFYGANSGEMLAWLSAGFPVSGLAGVTPGLLPERDRRKLRFWEEGELQFDLALSGFDYPYLEWEKRQAKPGINVKIPCSFNCFVNARLIADYQRWIARMLYTLEEAGYDAAISFTMKSRGLGIQNRESKTEIEIQVKKPNEASDFANFSAMFSPGGFRHLGFLALMETADSFDEDCSSGLGSGISDRAWDVVYDPDTRTLEFQTPADSPSFPEDEMTAKLAAILNYLQG